MPREYIEIIGDGGSRHIRVETARKHNLKRGDRLEGARLLEVVRDDINEERKWVAANGV